MKKKMIMSIVCAMALLFTAGCSGNEVSESAQQNSAPAAAAESTAEPSSQNSGSGRSIWLCSRSIGLRG